MESLDLQELHLHGVRIDCYFYIPQAVEELEGPYVTDCKERLQVPRKEGRRLAVSIGPGVEPRRLSIHLTGVPSLVLPLLTASV